MNYPVMLCKIGKKNDLNQDKYFFEIKFDGTRAVCYVKNKQIKLLNRRNNNITARYPEFKKLGKLIKTDCVLDGEIIVYNKQGLPDFNLLQSREQLDRKFAIEIRSKAIPATYIVFDILEKDGVSLIDLPLSKRKQILAKTIINNDVLEECFYTEQGAKLWQHVTKKNLEGVIAKSKTSHYEIGKRSNNWLKIKFLKTVDAIIIGYTHNKRIIASLCLAVFENNKLIYIGRVGTGFTEQFLQFLHAKLLKIKTPPIINPPKLKNVTWVKPELIAEVEYLELTRHRQLRAPAFKRLRYDKPLKDCDIQQLGAP